MNINSSRRTKLGVSALGLAVAIPLLAASGSAATPGGFFQVKAIDTETQVEAVVGMLPNAEGNPGTGNPGTGNPGTGNPGTGDPGTGNPGEQPADTIVASYICGPLTLNITQGMIDFSKANEDLYKAGRADEMVAHADGWKMIASGNLTDGMATGLVTNPAIVKLGEDIAPLTGTVNYRALAADSCFLQDDRVAASNNATFMVDIRSSGGQTVYVEGRWVTEEGKLRKVHVSDYGDSTVIDRFEPSDRYPTYISDSGSITVVDVRPTQVVDGVHKIRHTLQPETVSYQFTGEGNAKALRKTGPTFVTIVKATGKINSLKYVDSAGVEKTISPLLGNTNAEIIARYNTTTGQNWDGSLPSLDGYDLSAPFAPNVN